MKTDDFNKTVTSSKLKENLSKQFGTNVNLSKYSREQLEDIRNQFRTKIFQYESQAGYNELLTNETYQKDKAILQLLNTRIKEMLGEDIKKLKDKMVELSEAKKGVRAPKYTKKAKGTGDDKTGDGKTDFDDIQVARMTAGGVPKKQAIARATSDNVKEEMKTRKIAGKSYGGSAAPGREHPDDADPSDSDTGSSSAKPKHDSSHLQGFLGGAPKSGANGRVHKMKEAEEECNHTAKGKKCPVHGMKECGSMWEGKDEGKPGKNFAKIAKAAGGGEKGNKIAGKVRADLMKKGKIKESQFKHNVKFVNESIAFLLQEDEEGKAKAITAAGDMVNDFTSWMQRVGQYQTKTMIELADAIKADFGAAEAESFKQAVGPALSATLETLTQQREAISNAVAVLAGEATPDAAMGMEPDMGPVEPDMEPSEPDMMNQEPSGDELAASEPASTGRAMREGKFNRKLAESHSIMAKLAR